jgi:hypothetical protein
MKYMITATPGPQSAPPKMGAALMKAAKTYIESKLADGTFDSVHLFFGGGGIAIGNSDSHEQMLADMLDYPLYPFFNWEVEPLLELSESMDKYAGFYEKLATMMD